MSDALDDEATINALFAVASPAFNAKASPYFAEEEAEKLKAEAQTLWSNGHWLRTLLQDHGERLHGPALDTTAPTQRQLDEALAAIIISAFRIGAASVVHPANERHLQSVKMEQRRKAKALTPQNIKRDRIKKTVLPPLLARGASRTEQILELDKALKAENAGTISPAGADRWRKEILAIMAKAKISD
ncbi:hypothetical protein ACQKQD_07590 [Methylobacterium sp. NPDC080182]|uniref:hypothetical protein n=1 Tax=Methylobacterium sp. NPDC080182 TaxID=3390590 RepID=UPI003D008ECB